MMIDYCSIGKRIKLTRIKQGVLQKDLAEKIGRASCRERV
mgnify:CR=1 FL=1